MNRIKKIYCYLTKLKHTAIRIRNEEPDIPGLPDQNFDWEEIILLLYLGSMLLLAATMMLIYSIMSSLVGL